MTNYFFNYAYPPQRNFGSSNLPVVIAKEKEAYQSWLILHRNFPKTERFGVGKKIDQSFLDCLEWSFAASYLPPERKVILLEKILSRLDVLKFFLQLAWETKLVHTEQYIDLSKKLEEIGRMLGGWKKGLDKKLSPDNR